MTMSAATADIPTLTAEHRSADDWSEVDSRAVDTVRVLAADAVQKVGNGHPGTAMSLAPLAYTPVPEGDAARSGGSDVGGSGPVRAVLRAIRR